MSVTAELLEMRLLCADLTPLATHLVWAHGPHDVRAGQVSPVVVKLEDSSGHVIRDSPVTVSLEIASGPGAGGGLANVETRHGIAIFYTLPLTQAGSYAIEATSPGLNPLASASFAVSPGPAVTMELIAFDQPEVGYATFTLDLHDRYGNLATNDKSVVRFRLSPAVPGVYEIGFVLVGYPNTGFASKNAMRFVNGVAEFEMNARGAFADVSVLFIDSRSRVPPVQSPSWIAGS